GPLERPDRRALADLDGLAPPRERRREALPRRDAFREPGGRPVFHPARAHERSWPMRPESALPDRRPPGRTLGQLADPGSVEETPLTDQPARPMKSRIASMLRSISASG